LIILRVSRVTSWPAARPANRSSSCSIPLSVNPSVCKFG
jgi:hypothetical protein